MILDPATCDLENQSLRNHKHSLSKAFYLTRNRLFLCSTNILRIKILFKMYTYEFIFEKIFLLNLLTIFTPKPLKNVYSEPFYRISISLHFQNHPMKEIFMLIALRPFFQGWTSMFSLPHNIKFCASSITIGLKSKFKEIGRNGDKSLWIDFRSVT